MTLDELEGAINALQDELDVLRADARRAFTEAREWVPRADHVHEPLLTLGSRAD